MQLTPTNVYALSRSSIFGFCIESNQFCYLSAKRQALLTRSRHVVPLHSLPVPQHRVGCTVPRSVKSCHDFVPNTNCQTKEIPNGCIFSSLAASTMLGVARYCCWYKVCRERGPFFIVERLYRDERNAWIVSFQHFAKMLLGQHTHEMHFTNSSRLIWLTNRYW